MINFDFNLIADRAEGFDGFLQLQSGSDFYRWRSLQRLIIDWDWLDEDRYDDSGNLALVRDGQNHTFEVDTILTADEADTVNPPTNVKTLSYWIYQKEVLHNRITGTYVGKFLTKASSTPYVNMKVTLDVQKIGIARESGGVVMSPFQGRVIGFTSLLREAS